MIQKNIYRIAFLFLMLAGCKKFISIDPPVNQIITKTVFENDQIALSTLNGIYSEMIKGSVGFVSGSPGSITPLMALSADELNTSSGTYTVFQDNALVSTNLIIKNDLWDYGYKLIYYANSILAGLSNSPAISDSIRKEMTGEAKFIRAFAHFYLMNIFGEIPLVVSTDYRINNTITRSGYGDVYGQIIGDLVDAKNNLREDFIFSAQQKTRPNKWAAAALLARVYLYTQDWQNAELNADEIIQNTNLFSLGDLNSVFLMNSADAIWQLIPVQPGQNTNEAQTFIPLTAPATEPAYFLTEDLMAAFELNDQRRQSWIDSTTATATGNKYYYPFKYKVYQNNEPLTEYSMMLRISEQYLIRAEARAMQNKITGSNSAESDLNAVRQRAGLDPYVPTSQEDVLLAIEREGRIEYFCELGYRWFDLKRRKKTDEVLSVLKASNWQAFDSLYPIPQTDRQNNKNLSQNIGY